MYICVCVCMYNKPLRPLGPQIATWPVDTWSLATLSLATWSHSNKHFVHHHHIRHLECIRLSDTSNTSHNCCKWNEKLSTRVEHECSES